jgi:uncharacterized membrane protein YjgN (DUF898 family)
MPDTVTPLATVEVPPEPPRAPVQEPLRLPLRFTGTGGEYFRIWIVNLLLTVLTLGIYSAWAKVRKTRWFWSNTRLDGAAFQYHGRPAAILRGRILVGLLLGAYSLAGQLSVRAGVVAACLLGVLAPWLFLKALRFKLSNTSWRGIRFGFASTAAEAYGVLGGAVVLWLWVTAGTLAIKPGPDVLSSVIPLLGAYAGIFAATPLLHARIKRYQHGATTCGSLRFEMDRSVGAFYGLYARTFLVALPGLVVSTFAIGLATYLTTRQGGGAPSLTPAATYVVIAVAYALFLLVYAVAGAFFVARAQRLVWSRTRGGPIRFATSIRARALMGVWLRNGLLTVLSLGLYWPFAAVNIARYRLECMSVEAAAPLGTIAAGALAVEPSAAGEGAVDLFGWDVGL